MKIMNKHGRMEDFYPNWGRVLYISGDEETTTLYMDSDKEVIVWSDIFVVRQLFETWQKNNSNG